jgi:hypothetical protein
MKKLTLPAEKLVVGSFQAIAPEEGSDTVPGPPRGGCVCLSEPCVCTAGPDCTTA